MNYSKQRTLLKDKQNNSSLVSLFQSTSKLANNLIARQTRAASTQANSLMNSGYKSETEVADKTSRNHHSLINGDENSMSGLPLPTASSHKDKEKIISSKDLLTKLGNSKNPNVKLDLNSNALNSFSNPNRNNTMFLVNAEKLLGMSNAQRTKEQTVRNLVHDYLNIESNESTYNILKNKKLEKRAFHLDNLEDYDTWRNLYLKVLNEKLIKQSDNCENQIVSTRRNFIAKLELPESNIRELVLVDIRKIEEVLEMDISNRRENISNSESHCKSHISEARWSVKHYVQNLQMRLTENGYMLEDQIVELIKKLDDDFIKYIVEREEQNNVRYKSIYSLETKVNDELRLNFKIFEKKWKNIKLNWFMNELESELSSKYIVDNDIIYQKVEELRKDQIIFCNNRREIVQNLISLSVPDLNQKNLELISRSLEDVYANAQKRYDFHTEELNKYRNFISQKSQELVNVFFQKLSTINYTFGIKDSDNTLNLNEIKIELHEQIQAIEAECTMPPFISPFNDSKKKLNKKEEVELKEKEAEYLSKKLRMEEIKKQRIEEAKKRSEDSKVFIECRSFIQFYSVESSDEMIKQRVTPILQQQHQDRINFCTQLVNYIDEYDEYLHSFTNKLTGMFTKLSKFTDEHRKNLSNEETKYLVDIAKSEDNDEETNFNKEQALVSVIREMKESVHKSEIDEGLVKCVGILDELEVC